MDYHIHFHDGKDGVLSLEELRRRRKDGRLTGGEFVWREGMADWQALDFVLGTRGLPARPQKTNPWLVIGVVAAFLCFAGLMAVGFVKGFKAAQNKIQYSPNLSANYQSQRTDAASGAIVFNSKSLTVRGVAAQRLDFGRREYLDEFEKFGPHDQAWYSDAQTLFPRWLNAASGEEDGTLAELRPAASKLVSDPSCEDPLVLVMLASIERNEESARLLEGAVKAFPNSHYSAYPRFIANVKLSALSYRGKSQESVSALDRTSLDLFKQCFADGSFREADQPDIAYRLLTGWAWSFYRRNEDDIKAAVEGAGPDFHWLADILRGCTETDLAWASQSQGHPNTFVEGLTSGFNYGKHLGSARKALTDAWKLHPEWALAPAKMEVVAMGTWRVEECRQWFDRATTAQIDSPEAWRNMIWALNLRNEGDFDPLQKLGTAAIETKRFDTTVPSKFFDCVSQIETDIADQPGSHIYERADIWPQFQTMYEGYIRQPFEPAQVKSWRAQYAAVAFLAHHYDAARDQLQKLDWQMPQNKTEGRGADLSLLPLEVAGRTGPLASEISQAEDARDRGQFDEALTRYQKMRAPAGDNRTAALIRHRLASLAVEERLENGQWVDFLPESTNDLNWMISRGSWNVLPNGSVEIQPDMAGSVLFSRVRVGLGFEIKGDFETAAPAADSFQACVAVGLPDSRLNWYSIGMKKDSAGGEAFYSRALLRSTNPRPASLDPEHNTFDIRVDENGRASVSVNNVETLSGATVSGKLGVAPDCALAGFGAGGDGNVEPIRYSRVQLRRLK